MAFEIRRSRRIRASDGKARQSHRTGSSLSPLATEIGNMQLDEATRDQSLSLENHTSPQPLNSVSSILSRRYNLSGKKAALRVDTDTLHSPHGVRKFGTWPSSANGLRHVHFQKYREYLWQQGRRHFGDVSAADAFVLPAQLPEQDMQSGILAKQFGTVRVHTVVHSEGQSPVGMAREFDLASLRATVPEPTPSPRTPNFDSRGLLSAIMAIDADTPTPGLGSARTPKAALRTQFMDSGRITRSSAALRSSYAVPIHMHYARAHLPILASVMMSRQVRHGDTIELPVPHPEAWPETVAFVYTGEEELASSLVRDNIHHLGGRAW